MYLSLDLGPCFGVFINISYFLLFIFFLNIMLQFHILLLIVKYSTFFILGCNNFIFSY